MSKEIFVHAVDNLRYNYYSKKDPIPGFSGHSHNAYEFLYFLSGDATYVIEDKKYKLRPGDLIITRPSKYHFIQIDSHAVYERHDLLFDHKRLGINMHLLPDGLDVVNVESGSIIDELFKKFGFYTENFAEDFYIDIFKLLIQEMIYNLSIADQTKENDFSVVNPILSKALAYIGENLFSIKDISEVAQAVFVTDSYLFRLFKQELFKTPKKYITEKRLLSAQKQLRKGIKPIDVAEACGFDDYTTFYRNYTEHFGKKPSEEA
ncbi:MAG: helix-turn-helix domain-containing protein [Ruminococcaceae bacterium]|nr:helix-turn-helix domain-containing protein [Oscillospiraceae bacterium]